MNLSSLKNDPDIRPAAVESFAKFVFALLFSFTFVAGGYLILISE
jgi:hypothetical protein